MAASNAVLRDDCLRVVTYNIWFDPRRMKERTIALSTILADCDADVICLQEVVRLSHRIILRHPRIGALYDVSPVPSSSSYFALMLVKKEWRAAFAMYDLPSTMGRILLTALIHHPHIPPFGSASTLDKAADQQPSVIFVGTAHFESLASRRTRKAQLEYFTAILEKASLAVADNLGTNFRPPPTVVNRQQQGRPKQEVEQGLLPTALLPWVLCGDFNFCSYQNYRGMTPNDLENSVLGEVLPAHLDCWLALHPAAATSTSATRREMSMAKSLELGYTFDSVRNDVIHQHEQMRYDRILCSLPASSEGPRPATCGAVLRPVDMNLLGTAPIEPRVVIEQQSSPCRPQKASTAARSPAPLEPTTNNSSDTTVAYDQVGSSRLLPAEDATTPPRQHEELKADDGCETPPPAKFLFPSDHFGLMCTFQFKRSSD